MGNKSKTRKYNLFVLIPVAIFVLFCLFHQLFTPLGPGGRLSHIRSYIRELFFPFGPPSGLGPYVNKSDEVKDQIKYITLGLDMYKIDTGKYPSQETGLSALLIKPNGVEGWHGPYLKENITIKDPWGREFIYELPGEHVYCDLISYGADGIKGGTGDNRDFVYSEMYQ